ncbi:MAG: hypothetical protein EBQ96_04145 [Proteobacteria bacterium]|nr:hypothetical protein [Pseudomonadota bacterium]
MTRTTVIPTPEWACGRAVMAFCRGIYNDGNKATVNAIEAQMAEVLSEFALPFPKIEGVRWDNHFAIPYTSKDGNIKFNKTHLWRNGRTTEYGLRSDIIEFAGDCDLGRVVLSEMTGDYHAPVYAATMMKRNLSVRGVDSGFFSGPLGHTPRAFIAGIEYFRGDVDLTNAHRAGAPALTVKPVKSDWVAEGAEAVAFKDALRQYFTDTLGLKPLTNEQRAEYAQHPDFVKMTTPFVPKPFEWPAPPEAKPTGWRSWVPAPAKRFFGIS